MTEQQAEKPMGAAHTEDGLIHIQLESGATLKSKSVILSPGARWREMNVPVSKSTATKASRTAHTVTATVQRQENCGYRWW